MAHVVFLPVVAVLPGFCVSPATSDSGMWQKYYESEFCYFCWFDLVIKAGVVRMFKLLFPGIREYIGKNQILISMLKSPKTNIFCLIL